MPFFYKKEELEHVFCATQIKWVFILTSYVEKERLFMDFRGINAQYVIFKKKFISSRNELLVKIFLVKLKR